MNKRARRLAAAMSAIGAAAVLGTGTAVWAASSAFAAPSAAVFPHCAASQLAVWVNADSASGAAGSVYYHLDFTNTSRTTCHLLGYPGVSAVNGAGAQLGDAAGQNSAVPARTVNVVPGGTAHTILRVTDTGNYPVSTCRPVDAARLKVFAPGDTAARYALYNLSSCSEKGAPYLSVERVQAGT